jgi:hypothetical protein
MHVPSAQSAPVNDNGSRNPFADTRNVRNANTPTTGSGPTSNDVTLVSIPHTESTSAPTDRAKPAAG